ncbi:MAG: carbohydrate-binding domain-containing protein [Tannerella sp.]|jgi:hypothetical protein|nr:carbohydrate-binding domain-containing protein [Tannerella sp.]
MKRLLLVFCTALVIAGCSTTSEEIEGSVTQTFSVSGTITLSDGNAAAGASVMLANADGSSAGQSPVGATGEYVITGVNSGSYNLTATLSGYETGTIAVTVSNTDAAGKNLVLQKITVPTYTVAGVVTKPDGTAAAGASVQIKKAADNTNVGQAVTSDASGAYSISEIPAGEYKIIISLEGYETGTIESVTVGSANLTVQSIALKTIVINSDAVTIQFAGDHATVSNPYTSGDIQITTDGANVTVTSSATAVTEYVITGSTSNGSLKIQSPTDLRLTLNSVSITSTSALPPIQITKNEGVATVELKGSNLLADASSNGENATFITKKGALVFEGYGSLNISGAAKHAIASETKTTVRSGEITVTKAATDGFHSVGFELIGGSLTINASGDGIDAGEGEIKISGGDIEITSAADDTKGIKSDENISINGGSIAMSVSGKQSKGISSKKDIAIGGGEINITTSGATVLNEAGSGYDPSYCTAIKADGNIDIGSGNILINSLKTADGGKGISADGDIVIRGGTLNITTAGDGKVYTTSTGTTDSYTAACIKSNKNISLLKGSITCSSSGTGGKGINADGSITIGYANANNADLLLTVGTSGARFAVSGSSSGSNRPGGGFGGGMGMGSNGDYANPKAIKSEGDMIVNSGTITVNCTQTSEGGEGMESKGAFTVNGGSININSYDDCINGGTSVTINGGTIFVAARGQDAIDSNGSLTINGGLTIANGVRGDGESFDGQSGRYPVNGGIIVGTCGNLMETPNGPQRSVIYSRAQAGSDICIRNDANENILLFRVPVISGATSGQTVIVVFSDPRLVNGSYTLLSGGSIEGGANFNGYITGGSYSGGSSKSFSITSSVYTHVQ